jgi:3-hydroxyacyl-[acyl-carrier-protein] dehydratase
MLEAEASLLHDGSGFAVVEGRINAAGRQVAGAEITYRVVPFPNAALREEMMKVARRIAVPEEFFDAA